MLTRALLLAALLAVLAASRGDALLFSNQGSPVIVVPHYLLLHQGGHIALHQGGAILCHSC